jgi:hypothetical protein
MGLSFRFPTGLSYPLGHFAKKVAILSAIFLIYKKYNKYRHINQKTGFAGL